MVNNMEKMIAILIVAVARHYQLITADCGLLCESRISNQLTMGSMCPEYRLGLTRPQQRERCERTSPNSCVSTGRNSGR